MKDTWINNTLFQVPAHFTQLHRSFRCNGCGRRSPQRPTKQAQHWPDCSLGDWLFVPPTVISFSGGAQSKHLGVRALSGEFFDHPDTRLRLYKDYFALAFADTGSEHEETYPEIESVRSLCKKAGVDFILAARPGMSLHEHLIALPESDAVRVDQPPLFVDKGAGGRGRLANRCTREWKIAPMRRAVSQWLERKGYPKAVTKWIGLAIDEQDRVKEFVHDVQWERCTFPLLYLGITKQGSRDWLRKHGYSVPVRSLCKHCPNQSPADFAALTGKDAMDCIAVDEALRDMSDFGVQYPAYLSDTLIPVRDLIGKTAQDVGRPGDSWRCASGRCGI